MADTKVKITQLPKINDPDNSAMLVSKGGVEYQAETGSFVQIKNNLSDVDPLTARANLNVPSFDQLYTSVDGIKIFSDTNAGISGTSSGDYFRVPDDDGGLVYFINTNGTANEVAHLAGNASIDELKNTIKNDPSIRAFAQWEDKEGFILASLSESKLKTNGFAVGSKSLSMDGVEIVSDDSDGATLEDENGFIIERQSRLEKENISGIYSATNSEEIVLEDEYGFVMERRKNISIEDVSGKFSSTSINDLIIEDEHGFHIFSAMKAGEKSDRTDSSAQRAAYIAQLDNESLAASNSAQNTLVTGVQRPVFDYNLVITYGQSLSTGTEGWPALSISPVEAENVLMFGNAVRPNTDRDTGGSTWSPLGGESFSPLVAVTQSKGGASVLSDSQVLAIAAGATNEGESFDVGATNFWRQLQNDFRGVSSNPDRKIVVLNCGVQGRTVEQLSKGNELNHYNRVIEAVTKVKAYIQSIEPNASVGITAILYAQGEWNYWAQGSGTHDRAQFLALTKTLRSDIINDCAYGICQQKLPPAWITYQTGASYTVDTQDLAIGMAQLDMIDQVPGCFMATPVYQVTDKNGHLDSNGYRWVGMQFGKVMHKILDRGQNWEPLRPLSAVMYSSNEVIVNFLTPSPPLQFKSAYVVNTATLYPNKGFLAKDSLGVINITSVELSGQCCVSIQLSRQPSGDLYIWYAPGTTFHGNGNLCDSDTTLSPYNYEYKKGSGQYDSANIAELVGKPYQLNNWCCAFKIKVEGI